MLAPNCLPESPRLSFRKPVLEDAGFYLALLTDPDYIRFISDRGITSLEAARGFIEENTLPAFERNGGFGLWVVEQKDSGNPVGLCGLVVREGLNMPDLGYAFLKEHRGNGYAREAALSVLDFAHFELGFRELCAITSPENGRSAALLKKIGFRQDGQRSLPKIEGIADYFVADLGA
ncbi:GNAT family N-acetyltransferase [Roseibium sp.]|uniref:GNAT family N-acetyltransferase n=1 Tax=Roseibium sp. TaxID=1936156 RepID=UPI003B52243A